MLAPTRPSRPNRSDTSKPRTRWSGEAAISRVRPSPCALGFQVELVGAGGQLDDPGQGQLVGWRDRDFEAQAGEEIVRGGERCRELAALAQARHGGPLPSVAVVVSVLKNCGSSTAARCRAGSPLSRTTWTSGISWCTRSRIERAVVGEHDAVQAMLSVHTICRMLWSFRPQSATVATKSPGRSTSSGCEASTPSTVDWSFLLHTASSMPCRRRASSACCRSV